MDLISWLEPFVSVHARRTRWGSREDDVAGLERDILADDAQHLIALVHHLAGPRVHHLLAVDGKSDVQVIDIGYELRRDHVWPTGRHCVLRLATHEIDLEVVVRGDEISTGEVEPDAVAGDGVACFLAARVTETAPDHHGQLALPVELLGRAWDLHGLPRPDERCLGGSEEEGHGLPLLDGQAHLLEMVRVIGTHGEQLVWIHDGREEMCAIGLDTLYVRFVPRCDFLRKGLQCGE